MSENVDISKRRFAITTVEPFNENPAPNGGETLSEDGTKDGHRVTVTVGTQRSTISFPRKFIASSLHVTSWSDLTNDDKTNFILGYFGTKDTGLGLDAGEVAEACKYLKRKFNYEIT